MLILLLLLVALTHGAINCIKMKGGRDALLGCFSSLVDRNHDSAITPAEASAFFTHGRDVSGIIFRRCDVNNDGRLAMEDWNSPNACARSFPAILRTCIECERAGWIVPT